MLVAMTWTDILGWIGAAGFLASYVLASNGRMDPRSRSFQWLNVAAAALFVVSSASRQAWPSAGLNVIWIAIGAAALWRLRSRPVQSASTEPSQALALVD
jgi:hypothetical protein